VLASEGAWKSKGRVPARANPGTKRPRGFFDLTDRAPQEVEF
jgi:hypothetical protein